MISLLKLNYQVSHLPHDPPRWRIGLIGKIGTLVGAAALGSAFGSALFAWMLQPAMFLMAWLAYVLSGLGFLIGIGSIFEKHRRLKWTFAALTVPLVASGIAAILILYGPDYE